MSVQYGIETCPNCQGSLRAGLIPVERRGLYGQAEYYSLAVRLGQRLVCPMCGHHLICDECDSVRLRTLRELAEYDQELGI